ncbi:hypothetical protein NIES4101_26030 (plasmid) [Calothrix sp. NIES-4101]|nr:hypothetical protein NIES4101_26030 [Calothrix sp. NIES-4101]
MLDIMKRGTVQVGSRTWEYHGDDKDQTIFYITPQPVWSTVNNLPKTQLVEYKTGDSKNGSGYCTLQVQLGVPDEAIDAVKADIAQRFTVSAPQFLTVQFQTGTVVSLTYPDGEGGTTGIQVSGTDFANNTAIFQLPLTADQMKTLKSTLRQKGGSPFEIQYTITVPAEMPAVTCELAFDSAIALNYEVTSHEHTHWASSSTYTYDISEKLAESNASTITVTKTDPNMSDDDVNHIRTWGQTVISNNIAKEVAAALALQQDASGTQPFSISQVASFKETYQEKEVVLWRLQPLATLPSFADMELTPAQMDSLETTVDKRQFVAQVTPQCKFKSSNLQTPNAVIKAGDSPFMTDVKALDHVDVTISYPTLKASESRTHTFKDNTPYTWQADWDDKAGGVYSLSYVAVYADGTQILGTLDNLQAATYTLDLQAIGTLNVTFDASRFFTKKSKVVEEVTVDFVFNIPQQPPYLESATLNGSLTLNAGASQQATFSSVFPAPLATDYIYTVTYNFASGVTAYPYTSDAKQQNGQWVRLEQPDFQQAFNVVAQMGDGTTFSVESATVNFYYNDTPYFPDIPGSKALPSPTQSSPIQLNFPLEGNKSGLQMQLIQLFANTKMSPITVDATLIATDGSVTQIGPYDFAPQSLAALSISSTHQFVFVSVDPSIVDWETKKLNKITVHITQVRYTVSLESGTKNVKTGENVPVQTITVDPIKKQANSLHFYVPNIQGGFSDLEFDWYAEYIYPTGTLYAHGTEQGTSVSLPQTASEASPPKKPSL